MNLRILIATTIAMVSSASTLAQTTQKLTAAKLNEYGLVYNLPVNHVSVTLQAECTEQAPGPFWLYARKYLGQQPITEVKTSYKITQAVISESAEASVDDKYLVQFKPGASVYLTLTPDGFPLSVNSDRSEYPISPELPTAQKAAPTPLQSPAANQAVTSEMQQAQSLDRKAKLAAQRIFELRDARNELISGAAENMPPDGQALKLALENIDAQEAALTAMFLGTVSTSLEVRTYPIPGNRLMADGRSVTARLSQHNGLVDADDLRGAPIWLNVTVNERGKLPVNEKGEEKRFPKGGLAYRIPGYVTMSLDYDHVELVSQRLPIAQLGVVYGMDPAMFSDKRSPYYAVFNPLTGGIIEVGALTE